VDFFVAFKNPISPFQESLSEMGEFFRADHESSRSGQGMGEWKPPNRTETPPIVILENRGETCKYGENSILMEKGIPVFATKAQKPKARGFRAEIPSVIPCATEGAPSDWIDLPPVFPYDAD
jgi:hypothetical protein